MKVKTMALVAVFLFTIPVAPSKADKLGYTVDKFTGESRLETVIDFGAVDRTPFNWGENYMSLTLAHKKGEPVACSFFASIGGYSSGLDRTIGYDGVSLHALSGETLVTLNSLDVRFLGASKKLEHYSNRFSASSWENISQKINARLECSVSDLERLASLKKAEVSFRERFNGEEISHEFKLKRKHIRKIREFVEALEGVQSEKADREKDSGEGSRADGRPYDDSGNH